MVCKQKNEIIEKEKIELEKEKQEMLEKIEQMKRAFDRCYHNHRSKGYDF